MLLEQLTLLLPEDQISHEDISHPLGNCGYVTMYPTTESEISSILQHVTSKQKKATIVGGGTKRGFGGVAEPTDILLSLEKYKGIVEHSVGDLTIIVKSGTTLKEINDFLYNYKQMLPIDSSWPDYATIGGIIAANDSGPKRFKYGSARDIVLGLRVVYPDGKVIRTGGKVFKNVAGYDMNKLFIGSMGTLGVISEVTLKLRPLPKLESLLLLKVNEQDLSQLQHFIVQVLDSILEPTAIELLNCDLSMKLAGEYSYTLALSFTDEEKAVLYQEEWVEKHKSSALTMEVLHGNNAASWWLQFSKIAPNRSNVQSSDEQIEAALKLGTKNMDVLSTISFIDQIQSGLQIQCHGGVGHGISRVYLKGEKQEVLNVIEEIRKYTEEKSGYTIVTHLPFELRKQYPIWGEKPAHFPLLKGIKEAIDPEHALNSQRFVGGI